MAGLSILTPAEQDEFLDEPALAPPNGTIPNFDGPPNKNHIAQAVLPLCLAATTVAILLRTYARLFCVKKAGLPDALMMIAFGCYITGIYLGYRLLHDPGAFVHQWDVRVNDMPDILFPLFLSSSFYIGVALTIKAAILLEWVRIFIPYGVRNYFFWLCYGMLGANTVFYIVTLFLMNFACVPVERNWNPSFVGGSCPINTRALNIASAVLNLCSDVFILILPQRVIWSLNMSTKTQVGISVIFTIGVLGCVAAGLRLNAVLAFTRSKDHTYYAAPITLWALAEMACMFLIFGVPSVVKIVSEIRLPTKMASSLRSLEDRLTRRTGSKATGRVVKWPGSGMMNNDSQADTSHTYYRKINDRHGAVLLTTINSLGKPQSDSVEHLKDHVVVHVPEPGTILRTTQFETREDYGDIERELIICDGYDRQHPWAKDRIESL